MPPSTVTPSNIYSVWQKINSLRGKITQGRVKFKACDLVRITKEKVKFARVGTIFSTEIFQVVKVIQPMPQLVYELSHLQARPIEFKYYNYELIEVIVSAKTEYQIDKIVHTYNKNGIKTSCQVERIGRNL